MRDVERAAHQLLTQALAAAVREDTHAREGAGAEGRVDIEAVDLVEGCVLALRLERELGGRGESRPRLECRMYFRWRRVGGV